MCYVIEISNKQKNPYVSGDTIFLEFQYISRLTQGVINTKIMRTEVFIFTHHFFLLPAPFTSLPVHQMLSKVCTIVNTTLKNSDIMVNPNLKNVFGHCAKLLNFIVKLVYVIRECFL